MRAEEPEEVPYSLSFVPIYSAWTGEVVVECEGAERWVIYIERLEDIDELPGLWPVAGFKDQPSAEAAANLLRCVFKANMASAAKT